MPIKLKCSCGQSLTVPDALAGKTGKCPKCQAAIKIPSAAGAASGGPPSGAKPAATKPAGTKPAGTKPAPVKAGSGQPGAKPPAAKPPAAKSAEAQPSAAKQAAAKPSSAAKPAATKPVPGKPSGGKTAAAASGRPAVSPAASAGQIDALFDEIGLKKKTGPVCPKCGGSIARGAALCTHCGFHLQTGEQAIGFQAKLEQEEFQNEFLQEAANNMKLEILIGERQDKAGTPWWMLASFLLGALCIAAAGVVIVDATFNEKAAEGTLLGKLQRLPFGIVIGVTFAAVGILIGTLANLSIIIYAFRQGIGRGFAVWLIPFYSVIYGCMTWADNKSGIIGMIVGIVLSGAGIALAVASGAR